jgi:hypothetical protein
MNPGIKTQESAMKKQKKTKPSNTITRTRLLIAAGTLSAISLLAVGVFAGISKNKSGFANPPESNAKNIATNNGKTAANSQATNQAAQIKPLTQEEAQKLAAALKELANQSQEGLKQVRHADGMVSIDVQGRFQNVALAKRNEDGTISQTCIDNPASGALFFGIDPKLVGLKTSGATVSRDQSTSK